MLPTSLNKFTPVKDPSPDIQRAMGKSPSTNMGEGEKEVKTVTPVPKLFSFHEAAFLLLRPLPGPAAAWVRRVSCVGRRKINGTTGRRREKERKGFLSGWL